MGMKERNGLQHDDRNAKFVARSRFGRGRPHKEQEEQANSQLALFTSERQRLSAGSSIFENVLETQVSVN